MALGIVTYTATTWTAGDLITETKLDNMTANDQAYDSHAANGYLSNNDLGFWCKDLGGTNRELAVIDSSDVAKVGTNAVDCGFRTRLKMRVYLSANQTNVGSGSIIQFDSESYDPGADFAVGTYKYTVPVSGTYLHSLKIGLGSVEDGKYYGARIDDGTPTTLTTAQVHAASTSDVYATYSDKLHHTAGTVLNVDLTHNGVANPTILGGATEDESIWSIHLLSID